MVKNKNKIQTDNKNLNSTFPLFLFLFVFFGIFLAICKFAFSPYVVGSVRLQPYTGKTYVDEYPKHTQKNIMKKKFYVRNFSSRLETLNYCTKEMNEFIFKKYDISIKTRFWGSKRRIFGNSFLNLTYDQQKYVSKNKLYPNIDLECRYSTSLLYW